MAKNQQTNGLRETKAQRDRRKLVRELTRAEADVFSKQPTSPRIGRTAPPPPWQVVAHHWLIDANGNTFVARWDRVALCWLVHGNAREFMPEDMHRQGWDWLAPAMPPRMPS